MGALVIGSEEGQCIIIGSLIRVEVLKDLGNSFKIKINAPKVVSVLREEIYDYNAIKVQELYEFTNKSLTNGSLVINRIVDQSIIIADLIRIKLFKDPKGFTRLRIEAPNELTIVREEIYVQTVTATQAMQDLVWLHKSKYTG